MQEEAQAAAAEAQANQPQPDPMAMAGAMPPPGGPMGSPPEAGAQIAPTNGMAGLRELQNALAAGGRRVSGVGGPQ